MNARRLQKMPGPDRSLEQKKRNDYDRIGFPQPVVGPEVSCEGWAWPACDILLTYVSLLAC